MGQSFLEKIQALVLPLCENIGGHGPDHHQRMQNMYDEISNLIPGVDEKEYLAAVWLHSLDRHESVKKLSKEELSFLLNVLLACSGFSETSSRQRIVSAVLEHSKFMDDPDDSPLLQALRLADKWDRIGALGVFSGLMWLGMRMPLYKAKKPFGYGSTAEGGHGYQTNYENFYRVLEWYKLFPLIRELVRRHPRRLWNFLDALRAFAEEVSEAHGVPNTVEYDIHRCLGEFYDEWKPELRPR